MRSNSARHAATTSDSAIAACPMPMQSQTYLSFGRVATLAAMRRASSLVSSLAADRRLGLHPVIGWTEVTFEPLQGIAQRLPMPHEQFRTGGTQIILDRASAEAIETSEPSLPFRRQARQDRLQRNRGRRASVAFVRIGSVGGFGRVCRDRWVGTSVVFVRIAPLGGSVGLIRLSSDLAKSNFSIDNPARKRSVRATLKASAYH
jgi:hypothetical protein